MEVILKEGEAAEPLFGDKKIIQNADLYRFTSDSILLSRFVKAKAGENVADFCAGCGAVGFHFLCLNPGIRSLELFELQEPLADMAKRTAQMDGFDCTVHCMRVQDIGKEYNQAFSLILCNPPYETGGKENASYEKAICRKEITITLEEIIEAAQRTLKHSGRLAIINRADRTAELIYTLKQHKLEPKRMQYISGTRDAKPYLIMVEAVKGGRQGVEVLPVAVNGEYVPD